MPERPESSESSERADREAAEPQPPLPFDFASQEWQALLSRFEGGSDSALVELIEQEGPRILRRIERALPAKLQPRVGASDIFQQTLMDLAQAQARFDNRGAAAFRKLMNTMVEARIAQSLRRERAQKRDVLREVEPPPGFGEQPPIERVSADQPAPSQIVRGQEAANALRVALERLAEKDREILQMIDYDEISFAEAAERLGINVKAVHKRHSRALERLRSKLGDDDE